MKSESSEVCLGTHTLGGSTRKEMLTLASKDSARTRQRTYLSVKLDDCSPNKNELKELQRLNTQPEPIDPNTFFERHHQGQGSLRADEQMERGHPACVSIPTSALTISATADFHSP